MQDIANHTKTGIGLFLSNGVSLAVTARQ